MLEKNKVVTNTLYHFHSLLIVTWIMTYLLKFFFPTDFGDGFDDVDSHCQEVALGRSACKVVARSHRRGMVGRGWGEARHSSKTP